MEKRSFDVLGMSCAACSARVEKAVSSLDGVEECQVNLLANSMTVSGDVSTEKIISAVEEAGYSAKLKGDKISEKDNKGLQNDEKSAIKQRLVASIVLMIPLMYISMGHIMWDALLPDALEKNPLAIAIIEMLLAGIIMVINQKFFVSGYRGVIHGSPNMDTLVSLGSGASFVYSVWGVISMSNEYLVGNAGAAMDMLHGLYFESAAMILTLITIGKLLEAMAKGKTTDAINSLLELSPKTATVVRGGVEQTVLADEVMVGEVFVLRPGEMVAVDGVVIEGESQIVEAALTGESVPSEKTIGSSVLAATVNQTGYLKCKATKVLSETTYSKVIKMVEEASASKAPIAKLADKVSGVFVPFVLLISLLTLVIHLALDNDFSLALSSAISVLVVSCPCALGLATPVAIMVGSGVGARLGILYKNATALELSGRVQTVVFDKTGTVTKGEMSVVDVLPVSPFEREDLVFTAAAVEKMSEHPISAAIREYENKDLQNTEISDFRTVGGKGVFATVDGKNMCGVNLKTAMEMADITSEHIAIGEQISRDGKTPLYFISGGALVGIISVADTVRESAAPAILELKDMGIRTVLLTGDNRRVAEAIGEPLGFDEIISDVLPNDKEEAVRSLMESGRVMMVGDGINDAPALARADVGVAVGGGTDIAIESSDVVLMSDDVKDIPRAIRLGKRVLLNIKENLFWAFIYNVIGIPLAMGAFRGLGFELSPMFGAAAMSVSSFIVVMNALRLNLFGKRKNRVESEENIDTITEKEEIKVMTVTLKIEGMMCPHCEARVKATLEGQPGVDEAIVSHKEGTADISGSSLDREALALAVENAGYKVIG